MKKLALATVTAAIAFMPVASFAEHTKEHNKNGKRYERHVTRDDDGTIRERTTRTVKIREINDVDLKLLPPRTLALRDSNEKIHVNGEKIYLVDANGYKFFAPDGPYTTKDGVTYFAAKGLVDHTEGPTEVVYVDADNMTVTKSRKMR